MSCKVQQSVCSDCVTYAKSIIKFNTFNTFNNVVSYGTSNDFVDYSDASDHDGALVGTWWATGYASDGTAANFTMTIDKNGKVRFTAPSINIDNTTTCTTKNGHVNFDLYLTQATRTRSYIYVRESDRIIFYRETDAQSSWVWEKI